MIRKIIKIDNEKCNGCGLCVNACREGAITLSDGKAKLTRDDYCDGLGSCLPVCQKNAISFEEREAQAYDENAARVNKTKMEYGCSGAMAKEFSMYSDTDPDYLSKNTELRQWPIQMKLVPVNAPFFNESNLLIAVDCAAYSSVTFHQQYMKGKITIIGCPKLDNVDYTEKLAEIIARNDIKSVTVARMEVPCCSGIEYAAQSAVKYSGKSITLRVYTLPIN